MMSGFAGQPDEGYSEAPLNNLSASSTFFFKRDDAISALASPQPGSEFPPWLTQHIANLPLSRKTDLAMALLSDLPTSVIAQIVEQLNPRLYIDFVSYLPPEVCLKILGYLDPLSLISVARSCRAWYDLALDWKLWEQLYFMEGWRAKKDQIELWERKMNENVGTNQESRPTPRKRTMPRSPSLDADADMVMMDAGGVSIKHEAVDTEMTGSSIFGDPSVSQTKTSSSREQSYSELHPSSTTRSSSTNKGKGRATTPVPDTGALTRDEVSPKTMTSSGMRPAALWMWDDGSRRYKLNWRYLYTLRRRLEANWELGKYTNFQLPHPGHPEEGHGECIYSLQYNSQYLVSGSRDRTLKVWDMETRRCLRTLVKHRGSVLCLQFDSDPSEDIIVSGSSDSDVIIWSFSTGKELQVLKHAHRESVLNVKFDKRILVTCSKDKTIKIFNRRPLNKGDLGYTEVDPVPRNVKNYGYSISNPLDDFPTIPAWTMIGCLEGHSAAVNAVQIHEREVVSASGDRHIKVWDWPTQACTRTIVGHTKGIACVQYDGRRIVSGSSDNEVKVFDRQTGLEVASLRSHSNLVRTVQAGFGDLPYSVEEDAAEAKKVDAAYFKAVEMGSLEEDRPRARSGRRPGNAGSRRPEDICAYGAKLPPGGGGGKYGRIISGSYDTSIIIWRRDKEGIWKDQHHLKQEEAAQAAQAAVRLQAEQAASAAANDASRSWANITGTTAARSPPTAPTLPSFASNFGFPAGTGGGDPQASSTLSPALAHQYQQMIDHAVQGGQQALARILVSHPAILNQRAYVEAAIDRQSNPVLRSQLRQAFSAALIRMQFDQARQRREALRAQDNAAISTGAGPSSGSSSEVQSQATGGASSSSRTAAGGSSLSQAAMMAQMSAAQQAAAQQAAAAAAHQAHAQLPAPAHGVHLHQLQYDARRIICCSQTSVIVGWDFCNGDVELEEASRFFGHVQ